MPKSILNQKNDTIQVIFPGTTTKVSFTDSSSPTAALDAGIYRLCATQDCLIEVGASPNAATGSPFLLPASIPDFIALDQDDKIDVIQLSSAGDLYITVAN